MGNQLKIANQKSGSLIGGQVHNREPPRTEVKETFISCGEDTSDGGISTTMNEGSKTKRTWEKVILWLLRRLRYSRRDAKVDGGKGAGSKWYNAVKWKKGDNYNKTNVRKGDRSDEENTGNRFSEVSCSSKILDDFEREAYIGRRTSIGSVERNDTMVLFNILDELKDFEDPEKTKVNLRRLQRHILAKCGDSK